MNQGQIRLIAGLTATLIFAGCASGPAMTTGIYRRVKVGIATGYQEVTDKDKPGEFWVFFHDGNSPPFAKRALLYRQAEVTHKNGYRYFVMTDLKDKSKEWQQGIDMYAGAGRTTSVSGGPTFTYASFQSKIRCFKNKPKKGKFRDAYKILNERAVPGTQTKIRVKDRDNPAAVELRIADLAKETIAKDDEEYKKEKAEKKGKVYIKKEKPETKKKPSSSNRL